MEIYSTAPVRRSYAFQSSKRLRATGFKGRNDVPLPPTCDLAVHIGDAIALSDSWLLGSAAQFFRAVYLDKIADALAGLDGLETRRKYLSDVASGKIDAFNRVPSDPKNILWEMELCAILQRHSFAAVLAEPDIFELLWTSIQSR
jgi:hypothetical protein